MLKFRQSTSACLTVTVTVSSVSSAQCNSSMWDAVIETGLCWHNTVIFLLFDQPESYFPFPFPMTGHEPGAALNQAGLAWFKAYSNSLPPWGSQNGRDVWKILLMSPTPSLLYNPDDVISAVGNAYCRTRWRAQQQHVEYTGGACATVVNITITYVETKECTDWVKFYDGLLSLWTTAGHRF